jgi:iron complex outermembrane receptor protein
MKKQIVKLCLFISFIGIVFNSQAQDSLKKDTTITLNEIVVSYQANRYTPFSFINITKGQIESQNIGQEPSFILAQTPSITNYSDAGSSQGYSYFRIRGIDQTRINITLDGVPLNEPEDQGAYFSNYPDLFNSASKIQIQRGVGTSKNGVASFGGNVALTSPNLHDSAGGAIGLSVGSFNSVRAFAEYNSGIVENKAVYARVSKIFSDGYKYNSSNNSGSAFISTGLFGEKSDWKMNVLIGQQKNEMAWLGVSDSLIQIDRRTNANDNERDQFLQSLIQIQNKYKINSKSSINSSLYYTYLRGNYDFNLNAFLGLPTTEELYNYAFESNLVGFFTNYNYQFNGFGWVAGIHGNVYERSHIGSELALGELYANKGFKNEFSAFSKLTYEKGIFNLFADLQIRYAEFKYQGNAQMSDLKWQFFNPKVGISATLNQKLNLYYSVARMGREPTRNDMFMGNDDLISDSVGIAI